MADTNILIADFTSTYDLVTDKRYQYDYGQILKIRGVELPANYEVHFSNRNTGAAIIMIGDADGVEIPDQMFSTGLDIYAWLFLHLGEDDGRTICRATIPIIKRAVPTDGHPTPAEQTAIQEAIALLRNAITQTEANVAHYPKIMNGEWYTYDAATDTWISSGEDAHGNGIASMVINSDYTATFTFDNGTTYTTPFSIRGPQGEPGTNGTDGTDGKDGKDGITPAFAIGTVQSLPEGSSATATITGTTAAPLLNLGIPIGATGATGPTGPQGPAGAAVIEQINNWDTTYSAEDNKMVRYLYGYNASNAPTSGAHIVALELNFSATHRVQLAFRTNASTSNPVWVRHCNNGSWLGWGQITAAAPAT